MLIIAVSLGLLFRLNRAGGSLGPLGEYGGDTLWPVPFYALLAMALPRLRLAVLLGIVLLVTFGIELSQLFHPPWLESLRRLPVLGFLLGTSFVVSDLVCIGLGVSLCAAIDPLMRRR